MTLVRCHRGIRPVLPRGHRLYDVPGGRIYLDVRESSMMLARALGRYEEAKVQALREFLKPGATFIDIGANKGDFTVLAASIVGPSGRVIAIEPAKNNFRWLRRSVEENAIANAECHQIALGSDNYKGILHLATQSGLHSLLSLPGRVEEGVEIVDVRALDHFIGDAGVDAIKIDVEGFEAEVLVGADRTLRNASLTSIFLDIHPDLGVDSAAVMSTLAGYGLGLYEPTPPYRSIVPAGGVTEVVALRGGRSYSL
jgi:FkbM family methyltransferase